MVVVRTNLETADILLANIPFVIHSHNGVNADHNAMRHSGRPTTLDDLIAQFGFA